MKSRPKPAPAKPEPPAERPRAAEPKPFEPKPFEPPPVAPKSKPKPHAAVETAEAGSFRHEPAAAAHHDRAKDYTPPAHQQVAAGAVPGAIVWRYPVLLPGQGVQAPPLRGSPAVDAKGRIYAAVGRKLVALEEQDGQLNRLWEYATGGNIPGSPVLGGDGRIRVHSGDGEVHCLTEKGEQAWSPVQLGEPLGWASPVTDEDSNTWICGYGGGLIKIDARGSRQGDVFFRSRQRFDSTGLVHRGVFYVGAEDGFVYAISLEGRRGTNLWNPLEDKGKTEWFINSSPALAGRDTLIVAGRDEYLYAFDQNGDQLWKLHLRGQMLASPVVAPSGDVLVGVSLERRGEESWGKLMCIDGQSHKLRWEYRAEGPVESTPVIGDDGVIYFGDNKGAVHAVDGEGRCAWKTNVGSAVRSCGAIAREHRLVFGLDNGSLVALYCTSSGLPQKGWPKYMRTANQSGMA